MCDVGFKVEFEKDVAIITKVDTGKKIGNFKRSQGLYVGNFQSKNPAFTRPA